MYATFLQLALDRVQASAHAPTTGQALINLNQCRDRLALSRVDEGVTAVLADELSYDVALILLARQLEIAIDVQSFDQPLAERSRLERAIETTGLDLYPLHPLSPEGS